MLQQGIHRLVWDPRQPTRRAPHEIHGAIWKQIGDEPDDCQKPADKPLILAAYESKPFGAVTAYMESSAIGDSLPEMPLYVSPSGYVLVPLQDTYDRAFAALPRRWSSVLEK